MLHALNHLDALRASSTAQPSAALPSSSFPLAPKLRNAAGHLDLSLPAAALYHRYRACKGYLNLYTDFRQQRVNLVEIDGVDAEVTSHGAGVVSWHRQRRLVRLECGDGRGLWVATLQLANKAVMDAASFANGYLLNASADRTAVRFGEAAHPPSAQQPSSATHLPDGSTRVATRTTS